MLTNSSGSKCPKCEKTKFEGVREQPLDFSHPINFIRCVACKTVVGVQEEDNIGAVLYDIKQKLDTLLAKK